MSKKHLWKWLKNGKQKCLICGIYATNKENIDGHLTGCKGKKNPRR